MGNGETERFNQTLLKMLGTLEEHQKSDWKAHVPTLVHAYNSTHHGSTGYSPYFLMFGRHPRLAIDAFLGLPSDDLAAPKHVEYVVRLKERLLKSYEKARQVSRQTGTRNKQRYDQTARSSCLTPGDLVLIRNVSLRGKQKLADRWEHHPYVVIRQPNADIPVYEVKREGDRYKKTKILHRNLLLPFISIRNIDDIQTDVIEDTQLDDQTNAVDDGEADEDLPESTYSSTDERLCQEDIHVLTPLSSPRRSEPPHDHTRTTRVRRQPNWMTSGDFVV
jgi:hypothetical protein